jgi:iron complex outermembrane receptor protein
VRAAYAPRVVGSAAAVTVRPDSIPLGVSAPTMAEALRRMPFLYIRQNSRGEAELSVRGSESRQAAVFLEGVPLTLTWDARTDATIVPMAGVQRLDYVRGLSSLLAGPNAIGGVVSARLWDDHDPERRPERVTRTDLQLDQFGGLRTALTAGGALHHSPTGTLSAKAGGSWRDTPGLALPSGVTDPGGDGTLRLNTDARTYDLFAGARYEHAQGRYLSGIVSAQRGERGVAPELHVNAPRLWRNPSLERRVLSVSAGTGALRSRLGVSDVEAAVGLNHGDIRIDSYSDRTYRSVSATELGEDQTLTLRVTADQELGRHAVLRGAFTDATVKYREVIGTTAPADYRQKLTSTAVELDLLPSRPLTISGGVAFDAATTELAGGRPPLARKEGVAWRAGATWLLPVQGLRLHSSASNRRRFPALRELYAGALNRFEPNPELKPETARQAEVGATWMRGGFDAQVTLFTSRIDDAVVRTTLPNRRFFRVNRDRFESRGAEMTAGVALGRATLRYGSLLGTWALPRGVELQARARALGATQCTNPDSNRLDTQAGAATADLGAERRWLSRGLLRLRASLQVENVLDKALYDKCGLPQAGRTVRVGVTIG